MTPGRSIFQRYRRTTLTLLSIGAILAADLLGTAVLQWTGIYAPVSHTEAAFRREHPIYHHGLRPNTAATATWGARRHDLFTNSLGFKDASARQVALRTAAPRLLFFGDSFTEGIGVEYPETFVGHVDAALAPQGIEVLNAAVASYSPAIYAQKCRYLLDDVGLEFDRAIVFLDLSDIVDEVVNYTTDSTGQAVRRPIDFDERFKNFIRDHTILLSALRGLAHEVRASSKPTSSAFDRERSSWTRVPALRAKYGEPGLASAARHLEQLLGTLARHGVSMTLAVYPWPDQIAHRERDCIQVEYWRTWCTRHGVDFWDLFPLFLDAGEPAEVVARYFIPGDTHWNEAGHARVAGEILGRLE